MPKREELLVGWDGAGFETVAPEVLAARLEACSRCEHLAAPPEHPSQRVLPLGGDDRRICAVTGSVVSRMAALVTEHCPLPHPDQVMLDRWGEPRHWPVP